MSLAYDLGYNDPKLQIRPTAQSIEGSQLRKARKDAVVEMFRPCTYNEELIHNKLYNILFEAKSYCSLAYIERKANMPRNKIKSFLDNDSRIQRSLVVTKDGESVYFLKKPFSRIKDFFVFFQTIADF